MRRGPGGVEDAGGSHGGGAHNLVKLVFCVAALVEEPSVEDSEGQSGRLDPIISTWVTLIIVFLVVQSTLDNT